MNERRTRRRSGDGAAALTEHGPMTLLGVLGIALLVAVLGLLVLWLALRPAPPDPGAHDDLRRADDGGEPDPGEGLGSASYWPTT